MTAVPFSLPSAVIYQQIAEQITDRGYCIIEQTSELQALSEALIEAYDQVPEQEFKPALIGRGSDQVAAPQVRGDEIRWINGRHANEALWLAWMEGLRLYLNQHLFLGLFSYESHFAHYAPGAAYRKHLDAFRGQANRILSTVFYLNRAWQPGQNGELLLYAPYDQGHLLERVRPAAGTLVVFLSEEFPHEVLPAERDRYSIAGWFRLNASQHERVDPPR